MKNKGILFLFLTLLAVITPLFFSEINEAEAKPDKTNPDAYLRNSGNINKDIYRVDYLTKSRLAGNSFSDKYIHEAQRDGGYTCWAYNASGYEFQAASMLRHPFGGTLGKGNEAYGETRNLRQCEDGEKLIEYEIHASDKISNKSMNPSMSYATVSGKKANYLRFTGWATLGGFTHHTGWNQSTYVAAVEQVNGKNTTSSSGVHITKAVGNETNLTNMLQYGGIPKCSTSGSGTYAYEKGKEYNRFRGSLWYTSNNSTYVVPNKKSVLSFYWDASTGAATEWDGAELLRHYQANERWYKLFWDPYERKSLKFNVHGLGCNFNYPYAGFTAYLNLDDMIGNGHSEKDYKIYLIKRIEDMIVATEMQMPKYTESKKLKYGTVSFKGYDDSDTVRPNRTEMATFRGYDPTTWLLTNDIEKGKFDRSLDYRLTNVYTKEGYPSIYRVINPKNNLPYYHYAHYFDFNQANKGSTLSYKHDGKNVIVRHLDFFTCPSSVRNNINSNLNKDLRASGCVSVREKSSGAVALKGQKKYTKNFYTQWFYDYAGSEVYRGSKANDKFNSITPDRTVYLSGSGNAYVNFFYINQNELGSLTIKYIDNQTGKALRAQNKTERLKIGDTATFTVPASISSEGRTHYVMNNPASSIKITGNNVVTLKYNANPNVDFEYIDRTTGKNIGGTSYHHQRGTNFSKTPPSSVTSGGKKYYREDSGAISFNSLWADKTVKIYYTNMKDVTVRHYDFYSCDLSEATHMLGNLSSSDCLLLREKENGNIASKGSGKYETDMEHRFYKYGNALNSLYRGDRTNDNYYAENGSSQVVKLSGKGKTYINFFYKNRLDEVKLTVKYVDRQSGKTLRANYTKSPIKKGDTVEYPMPDAISDGTRPYYRYGNQTGRVKMTSDRTITVQYNYNPDVTVRKVDRDTGKLLGKYTKRITRGTTHNYTPENKLVVGGSSYYREDSGAVSFPTLWKDTTKTVYYSKYKDVTVRHYDFYSCDLSEATHMIGDLNPLGAGCLLLKEKDTGNYALYGSGRYETDMEHTFWKYANAKSNLFRHDRVNDDYYAENGSAQKVMLQGKSKTYINFFYKNRLDEVGLTVKYVDRQTGDQLQANYNNKNIEKGSTFEYPMPETLLKDGRTYYRYGNQTGRVVMTGDKVITVQYNYNPKVTVRYVDKETNKLLGTKEHLVKRGTDFSVTPQTSYKVNNNVGGTYFRIGSGAVTFKDLWKDTTHTEYYTNKKEVDVRHYDLKTCPSSIRGDSVDTLDDSLPPYHGKRKGNLSNTDCQPLKDSKTNKVAVKGSGKYTTQQNVTIQPYRVADNDLSNLYLNSKSESYILAPKSYLHSWYLSGINKEHFNYFYYKAQDVVNLKVEYIDASTNKKLKEDYVYNNIFKGVTVDYPMIDKIASSISGKSKVYYLRNDKNVGLNGSILMNGNKTIKVYYNSNPDITTNYVDRETGKVFHKTQVHHQRGTNFTTTTDTGRSHDGNMHYRIGGEVTLKNVWDDTTINVQYTDMRDVVVRHFDGYEKWKNNKDVELKKRNNSLALGSGLYKSNTRHKFNAYPNNLYKYSTSDTLIVDGNAVQYHTPNLSYSLLNNGTPYYVSFYYKSNVDITDVYVGYLDYNTKQQLFTTETVKERYVGDTLSIKDYTKGDTVTVGGRNYDLRTITPGGKSATSYTVVKSSTFTPTNQHLKFEYDKRPYVTVNYLDRVSGKVVKTDRQEIKYGSNWSFVNPETVSVGGVTYTSFNSPKNNILSNVRTDTTVTLDYTSKSKSERPIEYQVKPGTTKGMSDVDKMSWRMDETGISTQSSVKPSGQHAGVINVKTSEFYSPQLSYGSVPNYGTGDNKKGFKKQQIEYVAKDSNNKNVSSAYKTYTNSERIAKDAKGKHILEFEYQYTNLELIPFKCIDGKDARCFEWEEDEEAIYKAYFGELKTIKDSSVVGGERYTIVNPNATVEARDEKGNKVKVKVAETYKLRVELDNNSVVGVTGEDEIKLEPNEELKDSFEVGREFVWDDTVEGGKKITSGTYKENDSTIKPLEESLEIKPNFNEEKEHSSSNTGGNKTQQGVEFNQAVKYTSPFTGITIEDTDFSGTYLATLDKNLSNNLPEKEVGEGVDKVTKSEIGIRYDKDEKSFKLDKVFGLSKKYGIQAVVDYVDYKEDNGVLDDAINDEITDLNELTDLNLGVDKKVDLDYTKSRYFMPIDDAENVKGNVVKDNVELTGLGYNDITVSYDREISYTNYLYGNIFDDPVYASQKSEVKKVTYGNSEEFSLDELTELKDLKNSLERKDKVNLYRVSDDEYIEQKLGD